MTVRLTSESWNKLASFLKGNFLSRQLFFILVTLASILISGYHFGTFDQAAHLAFVNRFADPSLYPGDPFLELSTVHYSFFWRFLAPFKALGLLPTMMFIAHFFTTYLTFYAIWRLSMTLFGKASVAVLSVLFFTFPHLGFAGLSVTEFSLLNRTFVLPWLLLSIDMYLKKKNLLAFLLLGIIYNFHALSVHFVLALFVFDTLLIDRLKGVFKLLKMLPIFVVAALPLLIWRFGSQGVGLSIDRDWFRLVSNGLLYHLFYPWGGSIFVSLLTMSGIACLILYFFLRKKTQKITHDRTIAHFVTISGILVVISYAAMYFYPSVLLVQLQLVRGGIFILIFSYLYLANLLSSEISERNQVTSSLMMVILSVILLPLPLLVLPIYSLYVYFRQTKWLTAFITTTAVLLFVISLYVLQVNALWQPGIYLTGKNDAWRQAQLWARDNTAVHARFITPPHLWSLTVTDWRVLSERSSVFTYAEMLELIFEPQFKDDLTARFELLAPSAIAQFEGDFFENREIIKKSFYSLSKAEFEAVAGKYNAKYIVYEKPYTLIFPIVFENEGFTIYEVRSKP